MNDPKVPQVNLIIDYHQYLGFIAATLGVISFLPQVIKIWKSRSAKDISTLMYITYGISVILWLIYGVIIQSLPLIVAEILTFILIVIILMMKFLWK